MLSNPICAGHIPHREERYPGQHDAIIDMESWRAVQKQLSDNTVVRRTVTNAKSPSFLEGIIFDETGDLLSPSHAARNGRRYRYFVSHRVIDDTEAYPDAWRVRAEELEALVIDILCRELEAPQSGFDEGTLEVAIRLCDGSFEERLSEVQRLVDRVDLSPGKIVVSVRESKDLSIRDVSRTLQLAYLAPDIVEAILAGRQPVYLTARMLKRLKELPTEWPAQRQFFGSNANK